MDRQHVQTDSAAWLFFVKVSFVAAVTATYFGLYFLPCDIWGKGYLAMGILFVIGSSFTLSKTMRDAHEASKLINRISEAKTQKILKEYEPEV